MRTQCVACSNAAIDAAARDPTRSGRTIAREFSISEAAVRRHRTNHLAGSDSMGQRSSMAGGRPPGSTKFTEKRVQRFLTAIRTGSTFRAAALSVGWSEDSFQRYRDQDAVFAEQVDEAEGEAQVQLVTIVRQAARTNWRAALELLGRRWPETWGRHERVDVELRLQVKRLAAEFELSEQEILAEAERLVAGR